MKKMLRPEKNPTRRTSPKQSPQKTEKMEIAPGVFAEETTREDLLRMKEESKRRKEEEEKWEIPLSSEEFSEWSNLIDQGRYTELHEKQYHRIRTWFQGNDGSLSISNLIEWSPLRKKMMDKLGIPYSPLLGIHSLTANILVDLYGGKDEKLFEKLLRYIARTYMQKHKSASPFLSNPNRLLRLSRNKKAELGINEEDDDKVQDWAYYLTDSIGRLPKKALINTEAIESYLFTCVNNAAQKEGIPKSKIRAWKRKQKLEEMKQLRKKTKKEEVEVIQDSSVDVYSLSNPEKSLETIIDETMAGLILKNPIDKIILGNYGKSDSEIAEIVTLKTGKSITKQAIQKRRIKNIEPLIKRELEIGLQVPMAEDEKRSGYEPRSSIDEKSFEKVKEELAQTDKPLSHKKMTKIE